MNTRCKLQTCPVFSLSQSFTPQLLYCCQKSWLGSDGIAWKSSLISQRRFQVMAFPGNGSVEEWLEVKEKSERGGWRQGCWFTKEMTLMMLMEKWFNRERETLWPCCTGEFFFIFCCNEMITLASLSAWSDGPAEQQWRALGHDLSLFTIIRNISAM